MVLSFPVSELQEATLRNGGMSQSVPVLLTGGLDGN